MKISEDISKHIFYSVWLLMFLQMGKVIGGTLIPLDYIFILNIIDAAYDCVLILFAIGLIRLGIEVVELRRWKISSIILIIAAAVDITTLSLSYIYSDENWHFSPLIFIRLVLFLTYLLLLIFGFGLMKIHIDSLFSMNLVNQRGNFYISSGFILLIIPYIITWYGDYLYIKPVQAWVFNLGLFFFLLAAFLVIIGFLNLATNMRNLGREKIIINESEEHSNLVEKGEISKILEKGEED